MGLKEEAWASIECQAIHFRNKKDRKERISILTDNDCR